MSRGRSAVSKINNLPHTHMRHSPVSPFHRLCRKTASRGKPIAVCPGRTRSALTCIPIGRVWESARWLSGALVLAGVCLLHAESPSATKPEQVSVTKIWSSGKHDAFTDLIRFGGNWFCTFRESEAHVGGNGQIRVLTSADGDRWDSAAVLTEAGIDLRDPKFSITPDNRLMLVLGGSVYEGKTLKERQPRVAFSKDGRTWTAPCRVLDKGDWLWRVTWHDGRAYGITYKSEKRENGNTHTPTDWTVTLVAGDDGIAYRVVTKLDVPGRPNEATVRFRENGDCVALVRREGPGEDRAAWIGRSSAPYTEWRWHSAGMQIGGPNFIILPDGEMLASGRHYGPKPADHRTFVGRMDLEQVKAGLLLPSGGDCSYPGMVWHDGLLWLSYYSSHEGRSQIYLAKVRLPWIKP